MYRSFLFALYLLCLASTPASLQQGEWKDASPHKSTFVTVEEGVQLEVLDWAGGSGSEIVLLAGLGDTAHVYDDLAPILTKNHRVVGVTRRGHGRSSSPATGYASARLAEDVMRVIDATGLKQPVVVGHSMAGEEMHVLGASYAPRIAGLVYIDAAFNRADGSEDYDAAAKTLPPAPRPTPADFASYAALRQFLEKNQFPAGPEAHLRARYIATPEGTVRPWLPDAAVRNAFTAEMQAMAKVYQPARIRVPALAIYAVPKVAPDMMRPWYSADDPALRERVQTLYRLARERFDRHAKWFKGFAEGGRVAEMSGQHHLFISNQREVLDAIDGFIDSLKKRR